MTYSRDPPPTAQLGLELWQRAAGGAGLGKFVSRVRRPGAPAVVAQVLSGWVAMELPAVNLKVAMGGAGLPERVGYLRF